MNVLISWIYGELKKIRTPPIKDRVKNVQLWEGELQMASRYMERFLSLTVRKYKLNQH